MNTLIFWPFLWATCPRLAKETLPPDKRHLLQASWDRANSASDRPKAQGGMPCVFRCSDWFKAVGNGIHFCDTTKRASQRLNPPHTKRGIPYQRSEDKALDPTTLDQLVLFICSKP